MNWPDLPGWAAFLWVLGERLVYLWKDHREGW